MSVSPRDSSAISRTEAAFALSSGGGRDDTLFSWHEVPRHVRVVSYAHPQAFKDAVFAFLLAREAESCVALGVVETLLRTPETYPEAFLFGVFDGDEVVGTAIMTPPYPLGVSRMPEGAIGPLFEAVAPHAEKVSGVLASPAIAEKLAERFGGECGKRASARRDMRLYQLTRVVFPSPPAHGAMRPALDADRPLLAGWMTAFGVDAGETITTVMAERDSERAVRERSRFLWEVEGEPVAMAGVSGPTPRGIRVNYVYTPPGLRRRGYASELVATLSQKMLDDGRELCFLYTDLANPTSNRIYQDVGYGPLGDVRRIAFER